jgi:hypothetical protein
MVIPIPSPVQRAPRLVTQTPTAQFGKDIDVIRGDPAGGGGPPKHPFQILKVDDDTINVRYGTLQDIAPTNVATDIDLSTDGTHTVFLDVEIDINGVVLAVTLSTATTGQPADSDYHGYITLGDVVVASAVITTINQAATHSIRTAMCGRVVSEGPTLDARGTYEFWGF